MSWPGRAAPPSAAAVRRRRAASKKPAGKKPAGKKGGARKGGRAAIQSHGPWGHSWRWWLLRVVVVYLGFNLGLNLLLAMTRPIDFVKLFELGHLDSRSEAALMLAKHKLWHSSWEDEQIIPALVREAAAGEGIDAHLLTALVEAESAGKPHVISPVGACGLTQLMPGTAREVGVTDPFDPRQSLSGGARYLRQLLRRFDGNIALSLAAYNAGPGAVLKARGIPPFRETRAYVAKISRRYQILKGRMEGRGPEKPKPAVVETKRAVEKAGASGKPVNPAKKETVSAKKGTASAKKETVSTKKETASTKKETASTKKEASTTQKEAASTTKQESSSSPPQNAGAATPPATTSSSSGSSR